MAVAGGGPEAEGQEGCATGVRAAVAGAVAVGSIEEEEEAEELEGEAHEAVVANMEAVAGATAPSWPAARLGGAADEAVAAKMEAVAAGPEAAEGFGAGAGDLMLTGAEEVGAGGVKGSGVEDEVEGDDYIGQEEVRMGGWLRTGHES